MLGEANITFRSLGSQRRLWHSRPGCARVSIPMQKANELIDHFVSVLNRKLFSSVLADQISEHLRTGKHSPTGDPEWQICAVSNAWVADLEKALQERLPVAYRSLIARYDFHEFEIGPVTFVANMGELTPRRLLVREEMAPHLLRARMIQFGRAAGGSYDPVCFAMKRKSNTDAPIVQVDHEDILIRNGRIKVKKEIAPSFRQFIEHVTAGDISR